jgi:hypothetical protein
LISLARILTKKNATADNNRKAGDRQTMPAGPAVKRKTSPIIITRQAIIHDNFSVEKRRGADQPIPIVSIRQVMKCAW